MIRQDRQGGFTFIEVIVVVGIMVTLFAIVIIGVLNVRSSADINGTVNLLMTDVKNQQVKAMVGDTEGRGTPDAYSIRFQPGNYTLFNSENYSGGNPANFTVQIPNGLQITTTFPSSKIVFATSSGEIIGFTPSKDTVTITETATGTHKILQFNKYGTFISLQ